MNRTLATVTASAALIVGIGVTAFRGQSQEPSALPFRPAFKNQTRAPQPPHRSAYAIETIASGLDRPWSLAFLPNGHKLVTERNGTMRIYRPGRARVGAAERFAAVPAGWRPRPG